MRPRIVAAGLAVLIALAGCRKAEEQGADSAESEKPAGTGRDLRLAGEPLGADTGEAENPGKSGRKPKNPPSKYRIAKPVEGKMGFCLNPFTGNEVDVRGMPPGTVVRDPQDDNPDHKFQVPKFGPVGGATVDKRSSVPEDPKYPVGIPIPGKPGHILNPFTKTEVDVRGIPPGTLVMDPNDLNPEHKIRVPKPGGAGKPEDDKPAGE